MRKIIELTIHDLCEVAITCKHCETQIVLRFDNFKPVGARNAFAPGQCPSCNNPLDPSSAINELRKAWKSLSEYPPGAVRFIVPGEVLGTDVPQKS